MSPEEHFCPEVATALVALLQAQHQETRDTDALRALLKSLGFGLHSREETPRCPEHPSWESWLECWSRGDETHPDYKSWEHHPSTVIYFKRSCCGLEIYNV